MVELAVIGGGPAGVTASIYAKRAGVEPILIEKLGIGGMLSKIHKIENYPGFPQGITGFELAENMRKQLEYFEIEILMDEVIDLVPKGDFYLVKTYEKEIEAKGVIIATGVSPKKLGLPEEDRFIGRGISFCAVCDGHFYRGKRVVVRGCGNSGLQEGLYLSELAKEVIFVASHKFIAGDKLLADRVKKKENTKFYLGYEIRELKGKEKLEKVVIEELDTGKKLELDVDGLFVYIGVSPNTAFLKDKIKLDEKGFIITDDKFETNLENVFACGDVRSGSVKQVVCACAEGAIAALNATEKIRK